MGVQLVSDKSPETTCDRAGGCARSRWNKEQSEGVVTRRPHTWLTYLG